MVQHQRDAAPGDQGLSSSGAQMNTGTIARREPRGRQAG